MNLMQKKKSKSKSINKKEGQRHTLMSKKELAELKNAYKSGKLKFDSKDIADSVLRDLRNWFGR